MSRYSATIRHHGIARARVVPAGDNLTAAKRIASREFRGDFGDYVLTILDREGWASGEEVIATRRLGDRKWKDRTDG